LSSTLSFWALFPLHLIFFFKARLNAAKLARVSDEIPIVCRLLRSTGLNQTVSGKLAVAEVFKNLALLPDFAVKLYLPSPQILDLMHVGAQSRDTANAALVADGFKLQFRSRHSLFEPSLQQNDSAGPIQSRHLQLFLGPQQLAHDRCQPLLLAPFKAFAKPKHRL
jgi:hypothetical protein